jgi:tetratricopeptide (TPR) repeat protein
MRRVRFAVASIAMVASLAHADPGDATAVFERAKASYAAGDYAAATAAFRTAFELDPKADYLFGWAQAVRKGGDCRAALALYRKLLAMTLTPEQTTATQQAMARCAADDAPSPMPPRSSQAAAGSSSQTTESLPPTLREGSSPPEIAEHAGAQPSARSSGSADSPGWYADRRADALAGGGAFVIGAGTWLTVLSVRDERAARHATTYGEHDRLADRAQVYRFAGIGAIVIGTAGAALGVYRFATHRRDRATVTAWATRDGGGLTVEAPWR